MASIFSFRLLANLMGRICKLLLIWRFANVYYISGMPRIFPENDIDSIVLHMGAQHRPLTEYGKSLKKKRR